MRSRRDLIGSLVLAVGSGAVLAVLPGRLVDIPAGVALVLALAVLARSAIRLAGAPARGNAPVPPGRR